MPRKRIYIRSPSGVGSKYTLAEYIPDFDQGQVIGFFVLVTDVTELKIRELDLKEAQAASKMGSWTLDLATQTVIWSDQLYTLFSRDLSAGPPNFDTYLSYIHPEDRQKLGMVVHECIKTGNPYTVIHRVNHEDGFRWIEGHGLAIKNKAGEVVRLRGTAQDITDKINIEHQLDHEKTKALHSAKLAAIGEMAAGMAHEINNPLAIIAGNLSLLNKVKDDPEKLDKKIESCLKNIKRVTKIISGLRRFSGTQTEKEHKPETISAMVNESLELIDFKAKEFFVDISFMFKNWPLILHLIPPL